MKQKIANIAKILYSRVESRRESNASKQSYQSKQPPPTQEPTINNQPSTTNEPELSPCHSRNTPPCCGIFTVSSSSSLYFWMPQMRSHKEVSGVKQKPQNNNNNNNNNKTLSILSFGVVRKRRIRIIRTMMFNN